MRNSCQNNKVIRDARIRERVDIVLLSSAYTFLKKGIIFLKKKMKVINE